MKVCSSKVKRHLETAHKDKKDKPLDFIKKLRDEFQGRMTLNHMFTQKVAKVDIGMLASYKRANLVAKAGKPHPIDESLIMLAVAVVLSTVMNQSPQEVTSVIPLSNSSVSRHIDERATDVENQKVSKLQVNEFSLQLDGSTLTDNSALLVAFLRFLDIHEHLVAKNLAGRLHETLRHVIKAVNLIRNSVPKDRLFQQLCEKNNDEFEKFVLHTEVRWLSKDNCLNRFVAHWCRLISCFSGTELGQKLVDAKSDILYLSDIFENVNVLNKELQGNDSTLFSCKEAIAAFRGNLNLFWLNLVRRELAQFPSLVVIFTELLDDDLAVYVDHLKQLHNGMETAFLTYSE
ncbi:SCAN domain-containing protein 3-like [Palaemon carinicauda]|uniref:SCAN domain-containing protein 3-like n=1 Tax=Palaemon carinicauda TaxID=392227 RepID=UPI0035B5C01D